MTFTTRLPDNAMEKFEQAAKITKEKGGPFAWPDDAPASEPWAYDFHVYWVDRWNADGRHGDAEAVARTWLRKLLDEQAQRDKEQT